MKRILGILFTLLLFTFIGNTAAQSSPRQMVYKVLYANGAVKTQGATPALTNGYFYATWNKRVTVYDATPKDGTNRWDVSGAVANWQKGQVPWGVGGSSSIVTVREGDLSAYGSNVVGVASMAFSNGVMVDCDITVKPSYSNRNEGHHIVLHELGHCAGWKHVTKSTSIMYASVGPGSYLMKIDNWTLQQTRRVY